MYDFNQYSGPKGFWPNSSNPMQLESIRVTRDKSVRDGKRGKRNNTEEKSEKEKE